MIHDDNSLLLHCIAIFTLLAKELYLKPVTVKEEQSIYFVRQDCGRNCQWT
jgi:hypothetical protein